MLCVSHHFELILIFLNQLFSLDIGVLLVCLHRQNIIILSLAQGWAAIWSKVSDNRSMSSL